MDVIENMPECSDENKLNSELNANINTDKISTLSKRALKRLIKKQKWESKKSEKRKKERERRKQKRTEALKNNVDLGPSRKQLKESKMATSSCKTSVIIDMSFDHLMIPKDIAKTIKQLLRVYTLNRRSLTPMQLHVTNFSGSAETEISKHTGYRNWDVNFHSESYIDLFPKDKLVYLTSESENIVTDLESDKAYIIGGLVDHNAHKGLCYKIAQDHGISHGQLPIGEYLQMKSRKVLTIDQVFEILLHVSEGNNWQEALLKVIPERKGAVAKNNIKNSLSDNKEKDFITDVKQ